MPENLTEGPLAFVRALGKHWDESSIRCRVGDLAYDQTALLPGVVGLVTAVELTDTFASMVVARHGKARRLVAPAAEELSASNRKGKLFETGDSRLTEVLSWHPRCVVFGVVRITSPQHPRHISTGVPPVPERNERASKDKAASVASGWRYVVTAANLRPEARDAPGG